MAVKLQRIERELGEIADLAEANAPRASDGVAHPASPDDRSPSAPSAVVPAAPLAPQPATPGVEDEEAAEGFRRIPMAELLALGISHKTAPLELRERVALPEGRAAGGPRQLVPAPAVQE